MAANGTKRKPSEESLSGYCVELGKKKKKKRGLGWRQKFEALVIKTKGSSQGAAQSWSSAATHEQAEPPEPVQPCIEFRAICHLIYQN